MPDFGGVMRFTFSGTPLVMRGKLTLQPASQKATAGTNDDGSTFRTMETKGYGAKVTFEDSDEGSATGQDWDAILIGGPYNMSFIEEDTSVVHAYTNANFVGDVDVDRMNGEVTGLEIHGPQYNKTTAGQ